MARMLIVQDLVTNWSKASRGAPGAVLRNRVPSTVTVPLEEPPSERFLVVLHRLAFPEVRGFERSSEQLTYCEPQDELILGCVRIYPDPERTQVIYHYDLAGGQPERWSQPRFKDLKLGEWGQVSYNGRFNLGWESHWHYEKHVVNVGLFEHLQRDGFTHSPCRFQMSDLALLA